MNNCNICSTKCFGRDGYYGSCCTLEDRDYIIGRHYDTDRFLDSLSEKLGRKIDYKEVFIDFEEGSQLFPEKKNWQRREVYPALRVNTADNSLPCIFYNTQFKFCTVYDIRPQICKNYECDYLKEVKSIT